MVTKTFETKFGTFVFGVGFGGKVTAEFHPKNPEAAVQLAGALADFFMVPPEPKSEDKPWDKASKHVGFAAAAKLKDLFKPSDLFGVFREPKLKGFNNLFEPKPHPIPPYLRGFGVGAVVALAVYKAYQAMTDTQSEGEIKKTDLDKAELEHAEAEAKAAQARLDKLRAKAKAPTEVKKEDSPVS